MQPTDLPALLQAAKEALHTPDVRPKTVADLAEKLDEAAREILRGEGLSRESRAAADFLYAAGLAYGMFAISLRLESVCRTRDLGCDPAETVTDLRDRCRALLGMAGFHAGLWLGLLGLPELAESEVAL